MEEFYLVNKVVVVNSCLKITIESSKQFEYTAMETITINKGSHKIILDCEKCLDKSLYSQSPIIYSTESLMEDLKFLENNTYTIEVEHDNLSNLTLLPRLHNFSASPLQGKVRYLNNLAYAKINWESFVGKDSIGIFWNFEDALNLPIEIRAAKIDYLSDYKTMIDNINNICSDVLWSSKSTISLNVENTFDSEKSMLSKFFFIRAAFSDLKLLSSFEEIVNAPITKLQETFKEVTIGEVSSFDHRTIISMLNSPYWIETDPSASLLSVSQNSLPLILNEYHTHLSYDTTENRFIKYLLEEVSLILNELIVQYTKKTIVGLESFRLLSIVNEMLSHYILQEVKSIPYVETGNLAIRRVPGYSDFYTFFEQLLMSESLQWDEFFNILFHKQVKPIYDLYEAWVLTELLEILKSMSTGGFNVEFGSGKRFIKRISTEFYSFNLELLYQHKLQHSKNDDPLSSYSMRMDPDFLLNIYKGDNLLGSVVFDAKYKLNKLNELFTYSKDDLDDTNLGNLTDARIAKRVDLMTMHAYKDAIRVVKGSYVILPSVEQSIELWRERKDIVPSIGAIPLYPSSNSEFKDKQRDTFTRFIKKLITHYKRKST
ncbi:DUF2357 domain-containing protein [Neobacillus sp. PS3-40]|uniref:DUF2357 domain-containing protein n=1 Tax=Neobacillus sp. PS3-40 TaxID=3070679 RepID=UPI0027E01123|nr:DUF2357 domain-containing protein [Neobacillus sp. PS3-40]WML43142.1 DUF2357 domain-containing protein [Neobacillus sp. PS3-40]